MIFLVIFIPKSEDKTCFPESNLANYCNAHAVIPLEEKISSVRVSLLGRSEETRESPACTAAGVAAK
jgi:hypothetical protein